MTINYPQTYDSELTLYGVRDGSIGHLARDWNPGDDYLQVDDSTLFEQSAGFVTVYAESSAMHAERRATTFVYTSVDRDLHRLLGCLPLNNPIPRPKGCVVCSNIMADHRNALTEVALALEAQIGARGTQDTETIEWFANLFDTTIKIPRPWFTVKPYTTGFTHTEFLFSDQTSRLQSWQTVSWLWDFGDGQQSTDRNPRHVYEKPGRYSVQLTVANDYGRRTLVANNLITVLGRGIVACEIMAAENWAVAGESNLPVAVRVDHRELETSNPISIYEWLIAGSGTLPSASRILATFNSGGRPTVYLTLRTVLGNYSHHSGPQINVVERHSWWIFNQERFAPTAALDEYMPVAAAWKSGHRQLAIGRAWSSTDSAYSVEDFMYNGQLHEVPRSFEALLLYAGSPQTVGCMMLDCVTDVSRSMPDHRRGWGWVSCRTNWYRLAPSETQMVYLLFGHLDAAQPTGQSAPTGEVYDMTTGVWTTLPVASMAASLDDEQVIYDTAAAITGATKPKRIRAANWKDNIWMLTSNEIDQLARFTSFSPSTLSWKSLAAPALGSSELSMPDASLVSMELGLYAVISGGNIAQYDPDLEVWSLMQGASPFASTDESTTSVKAAARSSAPASGPQTAYITPWHGSLCASFDEQTKAATTLPPRTPGYSSAMGVF